MLINEKWCYEMLGVDKDIV